MAILASMTEAVQKKDQPQAPSMAANVAANLDSNALLMQSAAAKGERFAAARGLQNSTIGVQAAQRAMIDAAMPIAQVDTQNQFTANQAQLERDHQRGMTQLQADLNYQNQSRLAELQSRLNHDNEMKQLNAQVSANTIGKSIDFAQQITGNFDAQIAGILQNKDMAQKDKENAIKQLKSSRDSELAFMSAFFQAIPTTKQNWSSFPNLGVPTIKITG